MIVTWIAIQSLPFPWLDQVTNVAFVACGEKPGELALVRPEGRPTDPSLDRLLGSLEKAISLQNETAPPSLAWLRKAVPDQGTSIRLSSPRQCRAASYDEQVKRLASRILPSEPKTL